MLYVILPAILAAVLSALITPVTMALARACGAIDLPGKRKVHVSPIPRLGGVAVVLAAVVSWSLMLGSPHFENMMPPELALGIGAGLLPLFAVSLLDDVWSIGVPIKLTGQLVSAGIAVASGVHLYPDLHLFGGTLHVGFLAIPLSVLWIVGVTNAFNLADGLDGLSAGLALISSMSFAALGFMTGGPQLSALPLVLVGALLGFLPFNLYPARVFLGDCGATTVGFCLACLGLRSGQALSSGVAILVPVLVIGIPILDTVVAIARRTVRRLGRSGGGIFEADSDHIHHRLLQKGLGHRHAVLLLYGIAGAVAAVALGSMFVTSRNAALLTATLLAAAFIGVGRLQYDEFAVIRRGVLLSIYDVPVLRVAIFPVFFDIGIVVCALYLAIGLKYDDWQLHVHRVLALNLLAILPAAAVIAFSVCGLYRGSWRHVSIEDLVRSSAAVLVAVGLGVVASALIVEETLSLSFVAIYAMLLLLLLNGARSSFRLLAYWRQRDNATGDRVVIYGAGAAGALALREILANRAHRVQPLGFIDDDKRKQGRVLNGYPILGSLDTLDRVLLEHGVRGVIVGSDQISLDALLQLRALCARSGVWLMRFKIGLTKMDFSAQHAHSIAELETTLSA